VAETFGMDGAFEATTFDMSAPLTSFNDRAARNRHDRTSGASRSVTRDDKLAACRAGT